MLGQDSRISTLNHCVRPTNIFLNSYYDGIRQDLCNKAPGAKLKFKVTLM